MSESYYIVTDGVHTETHTEVEFGGCTVCGSKDHRFKSDDDEEQRCIDCIHGHYMEKYGMKELKN